MFVLQRHRSAETQPHFKMIDTNFSMASLESRRQEMKQAPRARKGGPDWRKESTCFRGETPKWTDFLE
ncbi:unnamed protein product [Tetraodon nigroviridis]|uniref:(spotted green pufferfish) hypothetical protein n=1 Tax=Tetraodon nigroviridis TaxID=99883 RepID=Q4T1X2_TETNG|nr:unnamed protein product [Tetraodon nigroviridis]